MDIQILFFCNDVSQRIPYIHTLYDYHVNMDTNEGYIIYDGYFYVEDDAFPIHDICMRVFYFDLEQTKVADTNIYTLHDYFDIDIYKREIIEDTSTYSIPFTTDTTSDNDDIGNVCLFPKNKEKLSFQIYPKSTIVYTDCIFADRRNNI